MPVDYHVHVAAHGEYHYNEEWLNRYLDRAQQRGIQAIGLIEHDEFRDRIDRNVIAAVERPDLYISVGLEIDFSPGREERIKEMIAQSALDFVMGSVHFIDGWAFDHPDHRGCFESMDIDKVYGDYFALIDKMVKSRLFDIVGHLDLIKLWGHRPVQKNSIQFVRPVLHSIKASRMVIEINSAGLRKPVQEMYPSQQIIEEMFALGVPITLGSDAHHPDQVAEGLAEVSRTVWNAGYRRVVAFRGREMHPLPLTL